MEALNDPVVGAKFGGSDFCDRRDDVVQVRIVQIVEPRQFGDAVGECFLFVHFQSPNLLEPVAFSRASMKATASDTRSARLTP